MPCGRVSDASCRRRAAHGFADGERLPLPHGIDNLRRIVRATELPVNIDLESGYGDVAQSIRLAIDAGAVGCNLEDSEPAGGSLRSIAEQCERLSVARRAADAALPGFFINARTDVFLAPGDSPVERAIERSRAYADAGADGLFTPGLSDLEAIAAIAQASSLPLNLMVDEGTPPIAQLRAAGIARLSYGPRPYAIAMGALSEAARAVLSPRERAATPFV
jgi:methylisocitrate lyase